MRFVREGMFFERYKAMTNENELFSLLCALCEIPAPSGEEDLRVRFCLDWLSDNGVDAYSDCAKNVIIPFGDTEREGITVFLAHTDTVFPDKAPLPYKEEGGKLFCPGIGDNTVHVAQLMLCARQMKRESVAPRHGMLLVLNSCEEGLGNLRGIKQIMNDFSGRVARVISFDGQFNSIVTRVVGSERYRVTVRTEGGHSFNAFENSNAIEKLAKIVCELYDIEVPHIGDSKTTYNVGMISGGTSVNTIAQSAEMLYEYRSDDVECIEKMRNMFFGIIQKHRDSGADISVETIGIRPCEEGVDKAELSALAERVAKICEEVSGVSCVCTSGSTDSNIPMSMGIPSITAGGYLGGGAHTREEWAKRSSVPVGFEIVRKTVYDFTED